MIKAIEEALNAVGNEVSSSFDAIVDVIDVLDTTDPDDKKEIICYVDERRKDIKNKLAELDDAIIDLKNTVNQFKEDMR